MTRNLSALFMMACMASAPAAVIQFDLLGKGGGGLLATNENGTVLGTPGTGGEILGGIFLDDVSGVLTLNIAWSGLQGATNGSVGAATGFHLHGPTTTADPFLGNAGVVVNISGGAGSFVNVNNASGSGQVVGTVTLTPTQVTDVKASKWYFNVHSTLNGGGEIRGNLVPVPEPGALAIAGLGLALAARRRRTA